MFGYIYKIYSYTRLLYNIRYISNHEINIDNDDNWIDLFVENIENCGSMAIKCVQWVLPRYQLTHSNSKLAKKFEKFYNNCYEHDLSHTKRIYYNNFNEILLDNYEILEIIGSGSIGQVYKIRHIKTDKLYALKVSHPNLNIDFYIFNLYFKLILKYFDYKQYVPVDNINYFIDTIKNQIDLSNEYENNQKFIKIYENNHKIIIPEVFKYSKEVLLMEYIESKPIDTIEKEYNINNTLLLLLIFSNNNGLNNISHGDLHKGNWGILDDKLVVYDFGFCFNINNVEYKLIDRLMNEDNKCDIIEKFVNHYSSKKIDISILTNKYKNLFQPDIKILIDDLINFFINNDIYLSSACINGVILFLQKSSYFKKIKSLSDDSDHTSYLLNMLSMCQANDMCPELIEYTQEKIKENKFRSNMNKDFSKFTGLLKFM
tara:strand:- start:52 stop:1341 length:1290 start_codon:yes stop_codon:yes gene_type:complete